MTRHPLAIALLLSFFIAASLKAGPAPANSVVAVDESFDQPTLGEEWRINNGEWKIVDGVLKVRELAEDNHAASGRRVVKTGNAVYECRFRLSGDARTFHVGFDPAPGTLEKKGHLFSMVITPKSWKLLKHLDKARPEEDPNEVLASENREIALGEWHTLRISTWGPFVSATLNGGTPLKGSHPSFSVAKPTVVFRCVGDGVEIDDLKVWKQKEG